MASSTYRPASRQTTSPLRRATSFALAVGVQLLIIWVLFHLGTRQPKPSEEPPLSTFALDADRPAARAAATRTATRRATTRSSSSRAAAAVPPPRPTPPVPTNQPQAQWPTMLSDSFDLASVPKGSRSGDEGRGDADAKGDSATAYGPGAGPGGQRMYDADWQREPSSSEIDGYLRAAAPPDSWALIACKTADDYRVEDCRVLGESPVGSGLGRAMREAAWQFRILPPRLGGKKLLGVWVRIRISWTERGAQTR